MLVAGNTTGKEIQDDLSEGEKQWQFFVWICFSFFGPFTTRMNNEEIVLNFKFWPFQ